MYKRILVEWRSANERTNAVPFGLPRRNLFASRDRERDRDEWSGDDSERQCGRVSAWECDSPTPGGGSKPLESVHHTLGPLKRGADLILELDRTNFRFPSGQGELRLSVRGRGAASA